MVTKSRDFLRRFDPEGTQDEIDLNTYDESILQQGRFWMRTVTWTMVGTTMFGVAWLPSHGPKKLLLPWAVGADQLCTGYSNACGSVADQILVQEGDRVKSGQVLEAGHRSQ